MSIIIIVLVFRKLPSFVRTILQREENKGIEFTVRSRNGSGLPNTEGECGQLTKATMPEGVKSEAHTHERHMGTRRY